MAASGLVLYGFVVGAHARQPPGLPGPRGDQRLRRVPAALPARPGLWIARARPAAGGGAPRLGGRPLTLTNWSARPRRLPRVAGARVHLRLAHDGLERPAAARLHRLPPRPLHARRRAPRASCAGDVFRNVVVGFQNPFASAFYILAMLALGPAHVPRLLEHAADARPQPPALEPRAPRPLAAARRRSWSLGNISIPLAVLAGLRPPLGESPWS